jgi:hypothetical protein
VREPIVFTVLVVFAFALAVANLALWLSLIGH